MGGGYAGNRDQAALIRIDGDYAVTLARWTLDLPAEPSLLTGRGSMLHAISDTEWRCWDVTGASKFVRG